MNTTTSSTNPGSEISGTDSSSPLHAAIQLSSPPDPAVCLCGTPDNTTMVARYQKLTVLQTQLLHAKQMVEDAENEVPVLIDQMKTCSGLVQQWIRQSLISCLSPEACDEARITTDEFEEACRAVTWAETELAAGREAYRKTEEATLGILSSWNLACGAKLSEAQEGEGDLVFAMLEAALGELEGAVHM